jgi:hypothetical protein
MLTAVYCFAVSVVTNSFVDSYSHSNSTPTEGRFVSEVFAKINNHALLSEPSTNNSYTGPVKGFKNPFNKLWATTKTSEHLTEPEFSQYTKSFRNVLIKHRKTDFIFPFHYFW